MTGQKPPPNPKPPSTTASVFGPRGDVYAVVNVTERRLRRSDSMVDEVFSGPRHSAGSAAAGPKIPIKRIISNGATREPNDTSHYSQIEITNDRYSVGTKSIVSLNTFWEHC